MDYLLLIIASIGAMVSLASAGVWHEIPDLELFWLFNFGFCITLGGIIIYRLKRRKL